MIFTTAFAGKPALSRMSSRFNYLTMSYLYSLGVGLCFTSLRGHSLDAFTTGVCLRVEGFKAPEGYWSHDLYYDRRRKLSNAAILFREFALHYFEK